MPHAVRRVSINAVSPGHLDIAGQVGATMTYEYTFIGVFVCHTNTYEYTFIRVFVCHRLRPRLIPTGRGSLAVPLSHARDVARAFPFNDSSRP